MSESDLLNRLFKIEFDVLKDLVNHNPLRHFLASFAIYIMQKRIYKAKPRPQTEDHVLIP